VEPWTGGRWGSPCVIMGAGAMVCSVALAVGDVSDALAALFFVGGVALIIFGTVGDRLLKGTVEFPGAGKIAIELAQAQTAREVTTTLAAADDLPVTEMAPNDDDEVTSLLLADRVLDALFGVTVEPLEDCTFQLYLYDPYADLLLPIVRPGHPGPSPGFESGQGAVGEAWATGEYVVATGPAASDDTFNLSAEQQRRYRDVTVAAAVPVTNAAGRIIGVVSGFSTDEDSALASYDGYAMHVFLAEAAARVLIDLLKWFSDGYDGEGGRETRWSAR
jgi:hypothetical protein